MWRSVLFVPVLEERFVAKALERGADAIVLDLEASIAAHRKAEARAALPAVVERLRGHGTDVLVRINTCWRPALLDLEAAAMDGVRALVVPDCREVAELAAIDGVLGELEAERALPPNGIGLVPILESAQGVLAGRDIAAAAKRVVGLTFGIEDYVADMEAVLDPSSLHHVALQVAQMARAAGVEPFVVPESLANLSELDRFRTAAQAGRDMGSRGGFAVHPNQVAILNDVFTPSEDEIASARKIVAAADDAEAAGTGAVSLDGRMIDLPIVIRAKRLLARVPSASDP